jgi:hypothetical protein
MVVVEVPRVDLAVEWLPALLFLLLLELSQPLQLPRRRLLEPREQLRPATAPPPPFSWRNNCAPAADAAPRVSRAPQRRRPLRRAARGPGTRTTCPRPRPSPSPCAPADRPQLRHVRSSDTCAAQTRAQTPSRRCALRDVRARGACLQDVCGVGFVAERTRELLRYTGRTRLRTNKPTSGPGSLTARRADRGTRPARARERTWRSSSASSSSGALTSSHCPPRAWPCVCVCERERFTTTSDFTTSLHIK